MTNCYTDFLQSAESMLLSASVDEITARNSMSRAYYGFYHISLEVADSISFPPVSDLKGPAHQKLSSFYEGSMHADRDLRLKLRSVGYSLKQAHRARVKADYKIGKTVEVVEATMQLALCQKKLNVLLELQRASAA